MGTEARRITGLAGALGVFSALALMAALGTGVQTAQARVVDLSSNTSLSASKTASFAVGTATHTIQVQATGETYANVYSGFRVLYDGKVIKSHKSQNSGGRGFNLGIEAQLGILKEGGATQVLLVYPETENGDTNGAWVYTLRNGKVAASYKLPSKAWYKRVGYHFHASLQSAKGKTVKIRYGSMSFAIAWDETVFSYKLKGNKLVQKTTTSKFYKPGSSKKKVYAYTANKKLQLRTKSGRKTGKSISAGKRVKIDKFYFNKKLTKCLYHVKAGKKSGWIQSGTKTYPSSACLFKNVPYAG